MNTTTDKTTLKNIKGRTAPFLLLNSGRPEIGPVGQSSVLSRLKDFIPELAQANDELPTDASDAEAIQIENVITGGDTSSSDSEDSEDADDTDDSSDAESSITDKPVKEHSTSVQFDVNLFKDSEPVEKGDPSIEDVVELPEGFREAEKVEEQRTKKIVEELS